MNELKQQLIELLKQNITLSGVVRTQVVQKLPSLSDNQTKRLTKLVTQANKNQEEALKQILAKEPYFYHRIEQVILHTMSEEFNRLTQEEINAAEAQLIEDLANYSA